VPIPQGLQQRIPFIAAERKIISHYKALTYKKGLVCGITWPKQYFSFGIVLPFQVGSQVRFKAGVQGQKYIEDFNEAFKGFRF
jgi:hypothetical protein